MVREPDATRQPAPQDIQLMSKHRVLSLKPQLRLEWRGQDGQSETEQSNHSASLGDSITASTRIRFLVHTTAIRSIQVVDVKDLKPAVRSKVDEVVEQTSAEEMQSLRQSIDATPAATSALKAKGLSSSQVVAIDIADGVLTLFTKTA
jgi:hypothetical protein